ncbi:DUF2294 domain-containing protein [Brasilonema bromeliae]|uniref:Na+-translocating membrane potential-generating system MpsC domain-containing protein n=1 Tax=Brasilonema bromeliae SPC951 TaxID=385972 RepID=A0ABX1P6E6_9CYAN|nr:DUF2294 domain-containing protein [Brasilonema bromeliae]NMG19962.1 hypothetical protein [Brasilonema bromeliae SPC951]
MTTPTPTRGQVERTLAQGIQALYRDQLGHQPSKVTCQLSDQNVVVIIENSITKPEKLLITTGHEELAEEVRSDLDDAIRPQLKALIEETLNVTVIELLSDATLQTGRTGIIAILTDSPTIRTPTPESNKVRTTTSSNRSNTPKSA